MATLEDYRNERLRKLEEIKALGIDPYPAKSNRSEKIGDVINNFDEFDEKTVTLAGRITAIRSFGKLVFIKIRDYFGEIQIFMKAEGEVSNGYLGAKQVKLLDTGDFIEATGKIGKSQTGEISIFANEVRLLTKSLRPLPGRDGFTNKEERYRRRYVDMNVNPEVRERMVRRSKFWQATREFMNDHGFIEINTPILEHTTGGADANPFVTHMDALDEDYYLRISQELPLKRLLGAGFEKVYDIGPRFRNEGVDDEHLPEHIAFESYAAYENYEDGMKLYEEMIKYVAKKTWGTLQFNVGGFEINLDQEWPRVKYADLLMEKFGVDVFNPDKAQLERIL
jgi:lysyl-tRNA synthetase class 2